MEDLELGNTLDDGTTLGSYSAALAKIGVNIQDSNGDLRAMDDILDDIIARWNTLSNSQQVALAQNVAGIRQYSQFMALLDNGDAFKQNVEWAKDSTGELQNQFLIYEESVEGAEKRIENTIEKIKNTLLDENTLVPILDGLDSILGFAGDLLEAFGGLRGVLLIVSSLLLKTFGNQFANLLRNSASAVIGFTGVLSGRSAAEQANASKEATAASHAMLEKTLPGREGSAISENLQRQTERQEMMQQYGKNLNENTLKHLNAEEQILEILEKQNVELSKQVDITKKQSETKESEFKSLNGLENNDQYKSTMERINKLGRRQNRIENLDNLSEGQQTRTINEVLSDQTIGAKDKGRIQTFKTRSNNTKKEIKTTKKQISDYKKQGEDVSTLEAKLKSLKKQYAQERKTLITLTQKTNAYSKAIKDEATALGVEEKELREVADAEKDKAKAEAEAKAVAAAAKKEHEGYINSLIQGSLAADDWATKATSVISGLTNMTTALSMITSGWQGLTQAILENDFSGALTSIAALGSGLTMLLPLFTTFNTLRGKSAEIKMIEAMLDAKEIKNLDDINKLTSSGISIQTIAQALRKKGLRIQDEEIVKDNQQTNNAAKNGITKAWSWAAANPKVRIPIAAAVVTLIGGALLGASIHSASEEKSDEQEHETSDEKYNTQKEKVSEHKEKSSSFYSAYKEYTYSGETTEELENSMNELAEAYDDETLKRLAYIKDYGGFIAKLQELQAEEIDELAEDTVQQRNFNDKDLKEAAREGVGHQYGKHDYYAEFNNGTEGITDEDQALAKAIASQEVKEILEGTGATLKINSSSGDVELTAKNDDARSYAAAYKALQKAMNIALKEDSNAEATTLGKEITAKLQVMSEYLEKDDEYTDKDIQEKLSNVIKGTGVTIGSISSGEEYTKFYNAVKEGMGDSWVESEDAFNDFISQYANVIDYNNRLIIANDEQTHDYSGAIKKDWFQEQLLNADEETANAMGQVVITPTMDKEEFWKQVDSFRGEAAKTIAEGVATSLDKTVRDENTYAKVLAVSNKYLQENEAALYKVTAASMTANSKLGTLTKTFDSNSKALFSANQNSTDYSYALAAITKDLEDFLEVPEGVDLTNFVHMNSATVESFINGNYDLLETLQQAAAQQYAAQVGLTAEYDDLLGMQYQNFALGESMINEQTEDVINGMNAALQAGTIAQGQLKNLLGTLGISVTFAENKIASMVRTLDAKVLSSDLKQDRADKIKKRKLDLDDEIERYHEINEQLDDMSRELDMIADQKDRAFGIDKLAYLNKEIALQEQSLELEKAKLKEAESYYAKDRAAILNYGASIGEDGRITNYDELMAAQLKKVNAVAGNDTKYEKAKENYDKFKEALDQYEDSLNTIEEQQQAVIEGQNKLADLALEKIQFKVEFKLEMNELTLDKINFQLEQIEDNAYAAAAQIALLAKAATTSANAFNINEEGLKAVLTEKGLGTEVIEAFMKGEAEALKEISFSEDEIDALISYRDALQESYSDLKDTWESMHDAISSLFEEGNNQLDKEISKIQNAKTVMEGFREIIETFGKENLGISDETLQDIYRTEVEATASAAAGAREKLNYNRSAYEEFKAAYDKALAEGDEDAAQVFQEKMESAYESLMESQQELNEAIIAGAEAAQELRIEQTDQLLEKFVKATTGYNTLDEMQQAQERQKEISELYLKDYEEVYELSKLTRQAEESINTTNSLKGKQALRDLQQEILEKQEDGEQISEYELGLLQKKYDLEQARINMEEAAQNKTQVRLQQDSQGNWGYVYTADASALADATQKYEDALYALLAFNDEWKEKNEEAMLSAKENFINTVREIQSNATLTEEERQKQLEEAEAHYLALEEYWIGQQQKISDSNVEIAQNETVYMKKEYDKNETNFGNSMQNILEARQTNTEQMTMSYEQLKDNVADVYVGIKDLNQEYEDNIKHLEQESGVALTGATGDFTDFGNYVKKVLGDSTSGGVRQYLIDTTKNIKDIGEKSADSLQKSTREVSSWRSQNKDKFDTMATTIDGVNTSLANLASTWTTWADEKDIQKTITITTVYKTANENGTDETGGGGGGLTSLLDETAKYNKNDYVKTSDGSYYQIIAEGTKDSKTGAVSYKTTNFKTGETETILQSNITDSGYKLGTTANYNKSFWDSKGNNIVLKNNAVAATTNQGEVLYKEENLYTPVFKVGERVWEKGSGVSYYQQDDKGKFTVKGTRPRKNGGTSVLGYAWQDGLLLYKLDNNQWVGQPNLETPKAAGAKFNIPQTLTGKGEQNVSGVTGTKTPLTGLDLKEGWFNTFTYVGSQSKGKKIKLVDWQQVNGTNWYQIEGQNRWGENFWIPEESLSKFDTGGYTGNWNSPEGRLAVLHEKELVLNKDDTANFLKVLDVQRQLQMQSFNDIELPAVGSVSELQQNVTISANFPNATNHTEIEEAFGNLINLASQYSQRK